MTSFIIYRFRSSKTENKILFEGPSLTVWELRSEIISQKNLISKDFDLLFFDSETNEKINDDYQNIHRNSTIIVERVPNWISKNKSTVEIRNYKMPPNYVCFRCGQRGHYIQHCPTNEDKAFDLLRFRKPTGIPKTFLQPVSADNDSPMLITKEGSCVKAVPQFHEWKSYINKNMNILGNEDILCNCCNKIPENLVVTNCGHIYCRKCVSVGMTCIACELFINDLKSDLNIENQIKSMK